MTSTISSCATLSDAELLATVTRLADEERDATAQLIASLVELDTRRLYLGEGCSSLFTYCTKVLHLSEHAAYGRIEAARAARRFPVLLDGLADGSLTLTTVCLVARHLTDGNHGELLTRAAHKSKREVEHLVAGLDPQPPVATSVRKLPPPRHAAFAPPPLDSASASRQLDIQPSLPAEDVSEPQTKVVTPASHVSTTAPQSYPTALEDARRGPRARPAVIQSLAPEQYKVQVTVGAETVRKLRRVQDLMRHTIPDGDPAAILDRALTMLLEHLERTRLASVRRPVAARPLASGSRQVPASVRRAVWARDEGRCAFVGTAGRCAETAFLEFHHVVPYAAGGGATIDTIELRCRAHNQYEAELHFGPRRTGRGSPSSPPHVRERRDVYGGEATRSGPS